MSESRKKVLLKILIYWIVFGHMVGLITASKPKEAPEQSLFKEKQAEHNLTADEYEQNSTLVSTKAD